MSKKVGAFLIALPALIALSLTKLLPAVQSVILSFKNYNMFKGIAQSEPVGLDNYIALFQNDMFAGVIKNSIVISALSILFTCVLGILLILCILRLPGRIVKTLAIALIAIPAFIPAVSFINAFMSLFSMDGIVNSVLTSVGFERVRFFAESALYPYMVAIIDAIRSVYIPVIIGVLVCESRGRQSEAGRIALVILWYVAARAIMRLSPDVETIMLTANGLTQESSQVSDMFIYRTGLQTLQAGLASAYWVVKTFLQLVISVAVFFLLRYLASETTEFAGQLGEGPKTLGGSILGILGFILFGAGSVIMIIITLIPTRGGLEQGISLLLRDEQFIAALSNSLKYGVISCIIYGIVSFTLAYPLRFSKVFYPFILVVLFSVSNNFVGEYLVYRQYGVIDIIYPIAISSAFSVVGAFALHFSIYCKLKGAACSFGHYLRLALGPLVVIIVLAFISNWGSFFYQNILVPDFSRQGVGSYTYQVFMSQRTIVMDSANGLQRNSTDVGTAIMFVSSAIPAAIGVLLIFLNKFLPLSAFRNTGGNPPHFNGEMKARFL